MGIRAEQKEKTRRAIIEAAFSQLSPEKSFANLSLREVTREAGIAPTSFYRHFKDMDELGLTLVDEGGLLLRQLMRQARKRITKKESVIQTSIDTFMEFVDSSPNVIRLLLRERSGTSLAFRTAVSREIQHFIAELAEYLYERESHSKKMAQLQAEAMTTLVFSLGADMLEMDPYKRNELAKRLVIQLKIIAKGAVIYKKIVADEKDKNKKVSYEK